MPEQKAQVLVIDDDPIIRKLIVTVSRQAGYVTSEASNGAEALEMVERGAFSLLILDLMLPNVSGHEVLEQLDPDCGCSVIVVTAGDDNDLEKIDSRLVCDIIRKPFDIHRLEKAIARSFENRPAGDEAPAEGRLRLRPDPAAIGSGKNEVASAEVSSEEEKITPGVPAQDEDSIVD